MKVFISWSGDRSRAIADVLRRWLPSGLQVVRPDFSPDDVAKVRWHGTDRCERSACRCLTAVLLGAVLAIMAPNESRAQDPCGCNVALAKDLVITESARSQTEAFLNIIDDRMFEEF